MIDNIIITGEFIKKIMIKTTHSNFSFFSHSSSLAQYSCLSSIVCPFTRPSVTYVVTCKL